MAAAEVTMPQNSLTTCIDRNGQYYRIPIACINDPVNYSQDFILKKMQDKTAPEKAKLKVSLLNG